MRAWIALAGALALFACGPSPNASPASPTPTPIASPNPIALAPNDCTSPPPASGTKAHSAALAATVTLPAGWFEDTKTEGQGGAQVPFVLELPSGTLRSPEAIWGDSLTTSATPHMAAGAEAAYTPGSGTVVARGDCTVAGSPASFFESSFFGAGGGYSLYIGHGGILVRLLILFWPETRDTTMPQVKSILGSWQWDKP
jgi:hypothetical protein